jgi:hypothetical protein
VRRFLIAVLLGTVALAIGCGGGGSNTPTVTKIATPTQNVQAIAVDGGPAAFITANGPYVNGAFVTITVCAPGSTTSCNTIDHVLVDTGSFGLRVLSSSSGGELTITLPATSLSGPPLGECVQFADNSFLWGPVETADLKIAGEQASSLPVNVVGDATFSAGSPVPSTCSNTGGPDDDNLNSLGANGILGVGFVRYDCGSSCASGTPPTGVYYQCPASGCVPAVVPLAQQVQNPVSLFASDNNGVIIELPAASGPQPSLAGSMVFGIGTQTNNALGNATVLTLNSSGNFTTKFNGTTMSNSFIDSGSNGLFFDDNSITICQTATGFYCPAAPTNNLAAVNTGSNGANSTVTFNVINAESVFGAFPNDAVLPGLAGPNDGTFTSFDFGLPFFYGKNVFTSIAGTTAPGGQTPYWAY